MGIPSMAWLDGILVGGLVVAAVAWVGRVLMRSIGGSSTCGSCSGCGTVSTSEPKRNLVQLGIDRSPNDVRSDGKCSGSGNSGSDDRETISIFQKKGDPSSVGKTADHPVLTVTRWDTA